MQCLAINGSRVRCGRCGIAGVVCKAIIRSVAPDMDADDIEILARETAAISTAATSGRLQTVRG